MGATILIPALIVVVVGGLGSLKGSLAGSLIIGQAETFGKAWLPERFHAHDLRRDGRRRAAAPAGALRAAAAMTSCRCRGACPAVGRLAAAVLLAAVSAFPLVAGNYPVKLLQEILIWGIFAMSLDLLMGYAGMVSFGHSAFFGIGGYVAALSLAKSPGPLHRRWCCPPRPRRSPRSSSASSRSA